MFLLSNFIPNILEVPLSSFIYLIYYFFVIRKAQPAFIFYAQLFQASPYRARILDPLTNW